MAATRRLLVQFAAEIVVPHPHDEEDDAALLQAAKDWASDPAPSLHDSRLYIRDAGGTRVATLRFLDVKRLF